MKIGVISDVHANLEALSIALEHLKNCDEIICLGDVCHFGADVDACFKLLLSLPNFSMVKGNHEAYSNSFYQCQNIDFLQSELKSYSKFMYDKTDIVYQKYIKTLPYIIYRKVGKFTMAFTHFSWLNHMETKAVSELPLKSDKLISTFGDINADFIFFGHTHLAQDTVVECLFTHKLLRYVNFGPLGTPHSLGCYAKFGYVEITENNEVKIDFYDIQYDCKNTISKISLLKHPLIPNLLKIFYNIK